MIVFVIIHLKELKRNTAKTHIHNSSFLANIAARDFLNFPPVMLKR